MNAPCNSHASNLPWEGSHVKTSMISLPSSSVRCKWVLQRLTPFRTTAVTARQTPSRRKEVNGTPMEQACVQFLGLCWIGGGKQKKPMNIDLKCPSTSISGWRGLLRAARGYTPIQDSGDSNNIVWLANYAGWHDGSFKGIADDKSPKLQSFPSKFYKSTWEFSSLYLLKKLSNLVSKENYQSGAY